MPEGKNQIEFGYVKICPTLWISFFSVQSKPTGRKWRLISLTSGRVGVSRPRVGGEPGDKIAGSPKIRLRMKGSFCRTQELRGRDLSTMINET